jgi:hypothetical protein
MEPQAQEHERRRDERVPVRQPHRRQRMRIVEREATPGQESDRWHELPVQQHRDRGQRDRPRDGVQVLRHRGVTEDGGVEEDESRGEGAEEAQLQVRHREPGKRPAVDERGERLGAAAAEREELEPRGEGEVSARDGPLHPVVEEEPGAHRRQADEHGHEEREPAACQRSTPWGRGR